MKLQKQFNYSLMELGGVFLKMTPQTFGDHLLFRKKRVYKLNANILSRFRSTFNYNGAAKSD